MTIYTVHQAETNLAKLLDEAQRGEEVTIARDNQHAVKLVAVAPVARGPRKPGALKGKLTVPDSFFDPLPDDELRAWNGE